MRKDVYEHTCKQIELAYEEKNVLVIEKETDYIITKTIASLSTMFSDKLVGINLKTENFMYTTEYLLSPKHKKTIFKWLERLFEMEFPASDLEFGKFKVDFETWYYDLGGDRIEFAYRDDYLLKPKDAAELLNVSKVTLNKYIKQGLECLDNGSQNKIPKHAVELMRDAVYSIRMQMNYQKKKKLEQTPQERLFEIIQEVAELQMRYGKRTYQEAFEGMAEGDLEDPIDYYRWEALSEEMDEILKIAGSTKGN
ncbi:helix-turn-helix domain-containing protein [Paenibacillus sp. 1A_MP2]|uniref:helix-turn-helix domain-containing protein n=1 Tax=Paenibacillus sp. 1A_MP2 TaxID=3457495 RepID=UPI003FCE2C86